MAQNGTPLVKEGDLIKEGTILIGGWLEGKYTGTRYVHANGQVEAKVWYTKKDSTKDVKNVDIEREKELKKEIKTEGGVKDGEQSYGKIKDFI